MEKIIFFLIKSNMFFFSKYISKLFVTSLIIILLYNIFSILIISFSFKNNAYFSNVINFLPYNYSIFFIKPLMLKKKDVQTTSAVSKKLNKLLNKTENKSALDYKYWEMKVLHQMNNSINRDEFEKNFINFFVLSKKNKKKNKSLKLYYLRNIPRFSDEVGRIVLSEH